MSEQKVFTSEQAKKVGEMLGINWSKFDVEQFRMGMEVELEHGKVDPHTNVTNDDLLITGKIALAHLTEYADYYTRLEKMEIEAEEFWKSKNPIPVIGKLENDKKIYTGKDDEEVLNCEGGPCNFVYDESKIPSKEK